jgi:hypothetical protein
MNGFAFASHSLNISSAVVSLPSFLNEAFRTLPKTVSFETAMFFTPIVGGSHITLAEILRHTKFPGCARALVKT